MSSYLLYEPNYAIRAFTTAFELRFHIFDPKGRIVQNDNFLFISQNNDLSLKLNLTRENVFKCILDFQNRTPDVKILKFHQTWDNNTYLEKCDFQRKLVCQFWDCHWIRGVKTSPGVVSNPDSESHLALHVKWGKL